jgi:hypothetical protein
VNSADCIRVLAGFIVGESITPLYSCQQEIVIFFAPRELGVHNEAMKAKKWRSPGQTATAVSLSKELFQAMENARNGLEMDRSNFIRMCINKELSRMRVQENLPAGNEYKTGSDKGANS